MDEGNDVYYRLYINHKDEPTVVCMQWFDEYDYDEKRFIDEEQYRTEEEAEAALLALKLESEAPLTNLERFKLHSMLKKGLHS